MTLGTATPQSHSLTIDRPLLAHDDVPLLSPANFRPAQRGVVEPLLPELLLSLVLSGKSEIQLLPSVSWGQEVSP